MAAFKHSVTLTGIGNTSIPRLNFGGGQVIAFTATASAPIVINASGIALSSTENCWIQIDDDDGSPSVLSAAGASGNLYVAADQQPFFLSIKTGNSISAVRDTTNGTISIVPVAETP